MFPECLCWLRLKPAWHGRRLSTQTIYFLQFFMMTERTLQGKY